MPSANGTETEPNTISAEQRVQARLRELDSLDARPSTDHAPIFEALHDDLQAVLADIESA